LEHAYSQHRPELLIVNGLAGWNEVQMGSIDFQIAALHGGTDATAAEHAYVPLGNAASPLLPAREIPRVALPRTEQDTVSLSGTLLPQQRQANAPSRGNAQPASFPLLSQTTTFPPSQDTAAPAAAVETSVPEPAAVNAIASSATQSPVAAATANAEAAASSASASSAAPAQQTLQQLDRVLQQLGIDPQTLSLISREGMLNWVNDPAALRQIVQTVQSAANSAQANGAVGAANPAQNTTQRAISGANQNQVASQTRNLTQAPAQAANLASSNASPAGSANTNALQQSAATAQQNAAAVMQFQQLENSLAPSVVPETQPPANPSGSSTPQGQLLNVSA
jgi:hypothetical protein